MRLYSKCTAKAVGQRTVSVFVVLIAISLIVGIADWLRYFEDTTAMGLIVAVTLLTIPQIISYILPLCLLIGAVSQLYGVIRNGEKTAMETAGLSPWQHAKPYVLVALLTGLVLMVVSEFMLASGYRLKFQLADRARNRTQAENLLKSGAFIKLSDSLMVFVESVNSEGNVEGLTIARHDVSEQITTNELFFHVKQGKIYQQDEGLSISGNNFAIAYNSPQGDASISLRRARVDLPFTLNLPSEVVVPTAFLPIRELFALLLDDSNFTNGEVKQGNDAGLTKKALTMFIYERIGTWFSPYLLIAAVLSVVRLYPWSRAYGRSVMIASVAAGITSYFGGTAIIRLAGEYGLAWYYTLGIFIALLISLSLPWRPRREH